MKNSLQGPETSISNKLIHIAIILNKTKNGNTHIQDDSNPKSIAILDTLSQICIVLVLQ